MGQPSLFDSVNSHKTELRPNQASMVCTVGPAPGFYLLGGGGGKVLPQTQHLPPQKILNKNYSKCTKVLIMHAHTTLSIVYLSTVSIDTCCWCTGIEFIS